MSLAFAAIAMTSCGESRSVESHATATGRNAEKSSDAAERAPDSEPQGLAKLENDRVQPRGRDKIALLVGIANYPPHEEFAPLEGPVHDIQLAHHTLVNSCGFDPADIRTLLDERATLQAIVESFQHWLIEPANPETQVVFWFCGHGSQVPDAAESGRGESDQMDESLLAYDSRIEGRQGEYDLIDDELQALVAACPSEFVTVVTDACHSGSALRGADRLPSRYVAAGTKALRKLPAFWPANITVTEDDASSRADARHNWVHIAAALDHETAFELPLKKPLAILPDASTFGLLTWSLTNALRLAGQGETYEDLAARARLMIGTRQTVSIEGNAKRTVLGGVGRVGVSGFPTRQVRSKSGTHLVIEAGDLCLVSEGAKLTVHDRGSGAQIGSATVQKADAVRARATWDSQVEVDARDSLVSRVVAYSVEVPRLTTFVTRSLAERVRAIPWFDVIENREAPTYDYTIEETSDGVVFRTREGHVLFERKDLGDPPWDASLQQCAANELRFRRLWNLATPGQDGDLTIDAGFVSPMAGELRDGQFSDAHVVPTPKAARGHYSCALAHTYAESAKPGAIASLAILDVAVGERVAVAVLSLSEARRFGDSGTTGIDVIHPHPDTPGDKWIEDHRRIPIELGLNEDWDLERPAIERYLILAIDREFDVHASFSAGLRGSETTKLPAMLDELVRVPRTRSARAVATNDARWRAFAVDVEIRKTHEK
ncbi:MAG: caspase family protein [Planctomycetes bacterium]|nr:caspase family protein [Planctomycetota bacterium]